jgi:ABC-type branched-subunit amino acid transport system permease subunit
MAGIVEAALTGLLTGAVYALMASGLTLIFGVMDIINVGQGAFVILGAYLSYVLSQYLHIDLFVGLLISMPLMFGLGVLIEWVCIRPLTVDRTMLSILVTFALALIIEGTLSQVFSTNLIQLHAWYVDASFKIGDFYLGYIYVFGFVLSLVLLGGLYVLLYATKFGQSVRALMQNRTAAALIGIRVERVSARRIDRFVEHAGHRGYHRVSVVSRVGKHRFLRGAGYHPAGASARAFWPERSEETMKGYSMVALLAVLLLIFIAFPFVFSNPAVTSIAVFALIFAVAATGWNIFAGYTGYIALGHAAYFGIGAYTITLLSLAWHVPGTMLPFCCCHWRGWWRAFVRFRWAGSRYARVGIPSW